MNTLTRKIILTARSPLRWAVAILIIFVGCGFMWTRPFSENERVDRLYGNDLSALARELKTFINSVEGGESIKKIRRHFKTTRLAYKRVAVLIDYFHPAETKRLNGAALPRTEDDNPMTVYPPHGFQVLEEMIFDEGDPNRDSLLLVELRSMQQMITQFETQPQRAFKFKNEPVMNAVRLAVIRMMTLGITGFDSPVAAYSLPEAAATIEAVRDILGVYEPAITANPLFEEAIRYLNTNHSFNRFNRLDFITSYAQPIYALIARIGNKPAFAAAPDRRPLNNAEEDFFSGRIFNPDFYGPPERFASTPERIALGKKLFFDPLLSSGSTRSCATCHKPELAFTDGLKTAPALDGKTYLTRNTPTLWNSVFQTRQFWDSRTALLEHQLNAVVHNLQEMGGSLSKTAQSLAKDQQYRKLFELAYPNEEEKINEYTIANTISAYVRSLVAFNARFDRYMRGEKSLMTEEEKNGFNLFMGKAKCGTCHFMPLFNGLLPPDFTDTESEVLGVPASLTANSPIDTDEGKFLFSRSPLHKFAFKTPTLRNIELTAPYMHNGVFPNLELVMDFYNKGGGAGIHTAPANQTLPAEPLGLSRREIKAVIAFLKTLTDSTGNGY